MTKLLIIFAAALLSSCHNSTATTGQKNSRPSQESLRVTSVIEGLAVAYPQKVPTNPHRAPVDEYCASYVIGKPKSVGGRIAAKAGWLVTSETRLGRHDAVTFVGALEPSTSATCYHNNGNLAFFDGALLAAIVYVRHPKEDYLGDAEQIDPSRIRLNTGMPGPPIADVVLRGALSVEAVASEDRFCGGSVVVPNVFGQSIQQARTALIAHAWMPSPMTGERNGGQDDELARNGVPEVQTCAGTGYAFCTFTYRHRNGAGLRVITMGEEVPSVVGSTVVCRS